ncbi:hypothetical protein HPT27_14065 [Permianibacter sp. IMCC34836]|uniref:hypothetical protein n=1 Tax=Permianibacter fluminis TaxID=2738515 RepID=UPI00155187A2|nr:hypothetical protein [Permianibacter fluminis]NQD38152.1 hypothetical protein [Permianibacter fluminis]
MNDIYIEDFHRDVAIALIRLYATFPRPAALYVDEIAGSDDPDEFGVQSERHQRCLGSLIWLGEEGVIRYRDMIGLEGIDAAVLTLRGFRALHEGQGPAIEQLTINTVREALRERNSEAVKRSVQRFFSSYVLQRGPD